MEKIPEEFQKVAAYLASPVPEGTLTEEESDAIIDRLYADDFFRARKREVTDEIWNAIVRDYKMLAAFLHDYGDAMDGKPTRKEEYHKHFRRSVRKIYDRLIKQGNVEDPTDKVFSAFLDGIPIGDILPPSMEKLNQENKQMNEQAVEGILQEWKPFDVDERFIKPGELHEYSRFGASEAEGVSWRPIYIDSVQIVGGQVFLGIRDVLNWNTESDYILCDTVYFVSLFMFSRLQRIGTASRNNEEHKAYNEMMIRQEQELAAKKAAEAAHTQTEVTEPITNDEL